jgi:hypothetical protein
MIKILRSGEVRLALVAWVSFLLVPAAANAQSSRPAVNTFEELGPAITACWRPPAGSENSEITLRFGLTGKGALRGPPMVTYSKLVGDPSLQKGFAASAFRAVAECTPVPLTEAFGRIVAGRVLTIRFALKLKERPPI